MPTGHTWLQRSSCIHVYSEPTMSFYSCSLCFSYFLRWCFAAGACMRCGDTLPVCFLWETQASGLFCISYFPPVCSIVYIARCEYTGTWSSPRLVRCYVGIHQPANSRASISALGMCVSVCLSVSLSAFLFSSRPSDRDQILQAYANWSGNYSNLKTFDPPHTRGFPGGF